MYVADTSNHRILAWRNPANLTMGNQADMVIGQRDFVSNFNLGPATSLTSGLTLPSSVAADSAGNLYVLDTGNNRIVRYPNPFNQTTSPILIDLVIGKTQSSGNIANENNPKPSAKTLSFYPGHFASWDCARRARKSVGCRPRKLPGLTIPSQPVGGKYNRAGRGSRDRATGLRLEWRAQLRRVPARLIWPCCSSPRVWPLMAAGHFTWPTATLACCTIRSPDVQTSASKSWV